MVVLTGDESFSNCVKTKATVPPSKKVMSSTGEQQSPLLKLPAEIRNDIYFKVLVRGRVFIECKSIHNITGIFRACSQTPKEAMQIFYSQNKFVISNTLEQLIELQRFLSISDKNNTQRITAVSFRSQVPSQWIEGLRIIVETYGHGGTALDVERAVAARLGTQRRMDFTSIKEGIWIDTLAIVRTLAGILLEQHSPYDSISAEPIPGVSDEDKTAGTVQSAESRVMQTLCIRFMKYAQNFFEGKDDISQPATAKWRDAFKFA